jgi:hypothetical protein
MAMGFRGTSTSSSSSSRSSGSSSDGRHAYCTYFMVGEDLCNVMKYELTPYSNETHNTFLWKDFVLTDLEITSDKKDMIKHFNQNVLGFFFGTAAKQDRDCGMNFEGYKGCIPSPLEMNHFLTEIKNPDEFKKIRNNPLFHNKLQKIDDKYNDALIHILKQKNIMEKMTQQTEFNPINETNYNVVISPLASENSKEIQDWYLGGTDTNIDKILNNATVEVNGKKYKFTSRIYPIHYKISNMAVNIKGLGFTINEYEPDPNKDASKNKNYKYTFYVKIFVEEIQEGTSDQQEDQQSVQEHNSNGGKSRRKSSKKSRKSRRKSRKYKRKY